MRRTYFMGERDLPQITLSDAERRTLARASVILGRVRELRNDDDDDLTTDIALAHHVCAELSDSVKIDG